MPDYDSRSPSPTSTPSRRRMKGCARRCERACCTVATYFPLAFVYSLTTWAVWVDTGIGFRGTGGVPTEDWSRKASSILGIVLYILLNSSYTVAVFTDPGSPSQTLAKNQRGGKYSVLPTSEPSHDLHDIQSVTVSSTGGSRFCKKCQVMKPDRTHHCSTCKRCVLKMDHHCPWLATCLGLHNYKAFILFLIYVCLFCWVCFLNTARWVYEVVFEAHQYLEEFTPVNVVILAVLSGIIGLVLTGFTAWHLYLSVRGQTTIECLEKTRYLSRVRHRVEQNRQELQSSRHKRGNSDGGIADTLNRATGQILEFHANAVPGASRYEEGEEHRSPTPSFGHSSDLEQGRRDLRSEHSRNEQHYDDFPLSHDASPAQRSLRQNYSTYEADREQERYEEYLEDKETEKLPNAFDLGWRRNLSHLFGPNPWLWWLPVCNTTGDGWRWELSQKWIIASEEAAKKKEERIAAASAQTDDSTMHNTYRQEAHKHRVHAPGNVSPLESDTYGRSAMSMQTLPRAGGGRRLRRDFDHAGEDGEVGSFEVSDSEISSLSDDDYASDADRTGYR